ncbi:MAG: hypothetical protein N0C84_00975 [Candidatus Thiodiazotropha taylori]|uniref:Terminase n=1 Tax=Candidatus Thiodiazotropha taylori TaxID=2792791 RepID=A0A9E4K9J4_9GAMM|nr:hypothetical protein [Candidatus Thiodiazotropha taylori]MCW4255018.1 hypothetical protein [Candidatus Thiodiazotropha taylori]
MNDSDENKKIVEVEEQQKEVEKLLQNRNDDYAYGREVLYASAERLQDVMEMALEIASESSHPRAIEVATNTATALSDIAKKLMAHQQDIEKLNNPAGSNPQTLNQNVNVKLSTKDLLEMIKSEE